MSGFFLAPSRALPCLVLGLSLLAACAGEPKKAAPTTPAANGGSADTNAQCDHFADRMCEALGGDTEPCASIRSVREWLPASACLAADADIESVLARVKELRTACDTLTQKLCAELGADSPECGDVKHDMPRVPAGHCAMLLTHYPELIAQIRERAEHDKPLADDVWRELLAGTSPAFGPETAKVTIVEFSDFQCPYCAQAGEAVQQLREKYGDKIRFVFHQFPLSFHENARNAAHAALAAHAQGKFWPMHDLLFEHQAALDRKSLEGYAKQVGADVAKWSKSMDDAAIDAQVEADIALGRKVNVDGTPTMFLNGKRVENPTELDAIAPLIETALAR